MNNENHEIKGKILSLLRARIDRNNVDETSLDENISAHEASLMLAELQIFQLELEMQNQELMESHSLLENERSKFAGFFDFAPVGYFILDYLGIVEEANQTGANLLRFNKSRILAKRFQSFIAPADLEHFYSFLLKMQHSTAQESCEVKLLLQGDQEIYTRMEGISVKNPISDQLQYYLTVIDISESRAAQQKISDTSHRLEMTLNASGTGTWTMELGNNSLFLDDYSYSLLGISHWEFDRTVNAFIDLIHPDDQQAVRKNLLNSLYAFKEVEFEFRTISKAKETRYMSVKGKEIQNPGASNYFAGIIIDITGQKLAASQTQKLEQDKQRLILSTAFSAQEKERQKISSALHDSVCQILYGINMNLQSIQKKHKLQKDFRKVNDLIDEAIKETRGLSYELTPSVLRDFGFTAGISEMSNRFSNTNFKILTNIRNIDNQLDEDLQLNLFRMIQELINNTIKHAEASVAEINISTENKTVTLVVSDNGKGFSHDPDEAYLEGSGMRAIKHRIYLLNGNMNVQSSKSGTTVSITFSNDQKI